MTARLTTVSDAWSTLGEADRSAFLERSAQRSEEIHEGIVGSLGAVRVLRPVVLTGDAVTHLRTIGTDLARILVESVRRRARTHEELAELLGYEWSDDVLDTPSRAIEQSLARTLRPDIIFTDGVAKVLEFNMDSAIGASYHVDLLSERYAALSDGVLSSLPGAVLSRFREIRTTSRLAAGSRVLIAVSGGGPAEVRTPEAFIKWLEPMCERGSEAGLDVRAGDINSLRLDECGRLRHGPDGVDAVMRLTVPDVIPASRGRRLLAEAIRRGFPVHTPQVTMMLSDKRVMAWIHEDLPLMNTEDADTVLRHLPRTTWITENSITRSSPREQFVFKPGGGYGGAGVVIGRNVTARDWSSAVRAGVGAVLQEFVEPDLWEMDFLDTRTNEHVTAATPASLSPFLFGGQLAGVLVRNQIPDGGVLLNAPQGAQINTAMLTEAAVRDC